MGDASLDWSLKNKPSLAHNNLIPS